MNDTRMNFGNESEILRESVCMCMCIWVYIMWFTPLHSFVNREGRKWKKREKYMCTHPSPSQTANAYVAACVSQIVHEKSVAHNTYLREAGWHSTAQHWLPSLQNIKWMNRCGSFLRFRIAWIKCAWFVRWNVRSLVKAFFFSLLLAVL